MFYPCDEMRPCPPAPPGAFGYFEVTHDISKYCKAKLFDTIGKRTPVAVRFSTVGKFVSVWGG